MTAQFPERLYHRDRVLTMWSYPSLETLEGVISFGGFQVPNTALYRGYTGTWAIRDRRLYLIEIHGKLFDGRDVTVEVLVPGCGGRAFAGKFSGTINCPLEGGERQFERCDRMLRIHVTDGIVVGEEELDRDAMAREAREYERKQAIRDATRTRDGANSKDPQQVLAAALDYIEGTALETDSVRGAELLRKLAADGYKPAIAKLGVALARGAIYTSSSAEIDEWLDAGAKVGDSDAMLALASRITAGKSPKPPFVAMCLYAMSSRKHSEAGRILKDISRQWAALPQAERAATAAMANDTDHLFELGHLFLHGRGAVKDAAAAATCLGEAAQRGHAEAQLELARMAMFGDGVPRDLPTAIRWLRRVGIEPLLDAALRFQNLVVAQVAIDEGAWLGEPGAVTDVAPRPRFTAAQVAQLRAADDPSFTNQGEIGRKFEDGDGLPKSDVDAIYWYARAADRHDTWSEERLKKIDRRRSELDPSKRALEGAEYGDAGRLRFVGVRYVAGRGVRQDPFEAKLWCAKAAVRGSIEALRELRSIK